MAFATEATLNKCFLTIAVAIGSSAGVAGLVILANAWAIDVKSDSKTASISLRFENLNLAINTDGIFPAGLQQNNRQEKPSHVALHANLTGLESAKKCTLVLTENSQNACFRQVVA